MGLVLPIKESIKTGWEKTLEHFWFLLGAYAVYFGAAFTAGLLGPISRRMDMGSGLLFIIALYLAYIIFINILGMGLLKIGIAIVRNEQPDISFLWSEYRKIFNYLAANILITLITFLGVILFIIPGIIFSLKYLFAPYLIVDRHAGVIESLRLSSVMTEGAKWDLLLLGILVFLINAAGALAFGVGLIFSAFISLLAYSYIYQDLLGRLQAPVPTASAPPVTGISSSAIHKHA